VNECKPLWPNGRTHYRVNGNLNLSRSIGDLEYKRRFDLPPEEQVISWTPDVMSHKLSWDDEFMIIGCDGLWDCHTNQSAVDFVRSRLLQQNWEKINNILSEQVAWNSQDDMKVSWIVEELLDSCISKINPKDTGGIGGDNITAMVVVFNQSKFSKTT